MSVTWGGRSTWSWGKSIYDSLLIIPCSSLHFFFFFEIFHKLMCFRLILKHEWMLMAKISIVQIEWKFWLPHFIIQNFEILKLFKSLDREFKLFLGAGVLLFPDCCNKRKKKRKRKQMWYWFGWFPCILLTKLAFNKNFLFFIRILRLQRARALGDKPSLAFLSIQFYNIYSFLIQ